MKNNNNEDQRALKLSVATRAFQHWKRFVLFAFVSPPLLFRSHNLFLALPLFTRFRWLLSGSFLFFFTFFFGFPFSLIRQTKKDAAEKARAK